MLPDLTAELDALERDGLRRTLRRVESAPDPHAIVNGRRMTLYCTNNYLGLANHPRVKRAAADALERYGVSSVASRLISGNLSVHESCEARLANYLGTEAALSFPSGYAANLGAITALLGREDAVFSDALNHRSLIDACRLSRAGVFIYDHADPNHLARLLASETGYRRRMIVTDGVFSMDGDIAPLPRLVELARQHDAILMVDDAHGTGAIGPNGKGAHDLYGLTEGIDILMTSGSKGLGTFGGFIAGTRTLVDYLVNRSAGFIFTTALPPDICAATEEALAVLNDEPDRRTRLSDRVTQARSGLRALGFDTMASTTHILPILIGDPARTTAISDCLYEAGLLLTAIRPPTVPKGLSRLRLALCADHTESDIDDLLAAMADVKRRFF